MDLTIHEITGGNVERLDALLELFAELFPAYPHTLPSLCQRAQRSADANPLFTEHQWLIDIDGQAAAMSVFKYVPKRNLGLEIALAVRPVYRKLDLGNYQHLSEFLIAAAGEQLQADALAAGCPKPTGLVLEVVAPKLVARFREYGLLELPVEYYEVRFSQGRPMVLSPDELEKVEFHRAQLGVFPLDGQTVDVDNPALLSDAVLAFLIDHYGLPQDHWTVRRAIKSIRDIVERKEKIGYG